ncbi:MAG: hypothetical protein IT195_03730 [Microthrixaceae bacterium]|nr:hypothetical protein [Microthrixaceae bacterium]
MPDGEVTNNPTPAPTAALAAMRQRSPSLWSPSDERSRSLLEARLADIAGTIRGLGVSEDLVAEGLGMAELARAYDAFESPRCDPLPGSFAVVVPSRATPNFLRSAPSPFIDAETARSLWEQMCPFVVDRYSTAEGEAGVVIGCPLWPIPDAEAHSSEATARTSRMLTDAIDFAARRFGARVIGLGSDLSTLAALPPPHEFIAQQGVALTAGLAGSSWLLSRVVSGLGVDLGDVGTLGMGPGGAIVLRGLLACEGVGTVHVFDNDRRRRVEVASQYSGFPRVRLAGSVTEVLSRCAVTVSTTTTLLDSDLDAVDLAGRWIVDHSPSPRVDPHPVESRGGRICWSIGQDGSPHRTATKQGGGAMSIDLDLRTAAPDHIWGWEAEAHAIALACDAADRTLSSMDPRDLPRIGALIAAMGTTVAPLQRFGELI